MVGTSTRKKKEDSDGLSNSSDVKKIAIVGLPNTGKSQVFNNLTGTYTLVANYPSIRPACTASIFIPKKNSRYAI